MMNPQDGPSDKGQTLIQVAIAMFLLLVIVSLAIDVGHIYAERRRMQNAADAGALAGAYEICFGDPAMWETTALDYAINRNGAETAQAALQDYVVTVVARETVETYLAGIIGINSVDVAAVAEAACGNAVSLCGVWPISFHIDRWQDIECYEEGKDPETGIFYLFNDNRFEDDDECFLEWGGECYRICDTEEGEGACACDLIPPDGKFHVVGPGHRGWLNFPRPEEPYPDVLNCAGNCGAAQVKCWIDGGAYSGEVAIGPDLEGICLPGEPGVTESVRIEIGRDHIGETPNILLWDDEECAPEDVLGTCPGTPYHIVGTGCTLILDVLEIDLYRKPGFTPPELCAPNVKVIQAQRLCDCTSECGSTTGGPPIPGFVRSVSLIR